MNSVNGEDAIEAITNVYEDEDVSGQETKEDLLELILFINDMLKELL